MNKKIGIAASLIGVAVIGAAGFKMTSSADSVNISIAASAPTVEKEDTFQMTIEVSSDVAVQSLDSLITYNPEVLEFVSSNDDAVAGASGTIHIIDTFEEGASSAKYELTFKALEVGESDVTLGETIVQEYGSARLIDAASSPVSVSVETNNQVSSNNTLSELLVYPGEFDEAFSPDVYDYHMTVGVETENVVLSAVPADDEAVVSVDIPETLAVGENTATIHVKALSGDEAVYTVHITRLSESLPQVEAFSLDGEVNDDETEQESAETVQDSEETAGESTETESTETEMTEDTVSDNQESIEADSEETESTLEEENETDGQSAEDTQVSQQSAADGGSETGEQPENAGNIENAGQ